MTPPDGPVRKQGLLIVIVLLLNKVPPALIGKGLVGTGLGTTGLSQPKLFPNTVATHMLLAIWQEEAAIQMYCRWVHHVGRVCVT